MFLSVKKPNLPISGDFMIDTRLKGERVVINPDWKSKNGKHLIRVEIIDEKDLDLIGNFYNYNNYLNLINVKPEETEKFAFDAVKKCLFQPLSFAAFDGEKLVGIQLNRFHIPSEFPQIFDGFNENNPKFIIKEDYSNEIQNAPYTFEANKIYVNLEECFRQTGKFLPKEIKNLGVIKSIGIHPNYRG
uniref:Uncharacterized protein n=1 Tax=Panagrolaimus davidi TaxID=227884 RepID=A0A914P489_9BILA